VGGEGCLEGLGGAVGTMARSDGDWPFVGRVLLVEGWSAKLSILILEE
jgi:hypothetical protein